MDHPLPIIGGLTQGLRRTDSEVTAPRGDSDRHDTARLGTALGTTEVRVDGGDAALPEAHSGDSSPGIILDRWPSLAAGMSRYHRATAEEFSGAAYARVSAGLIRLDDRRRLAALAQDLGIREFDAQLLIACAIRQWALDHRADTQPNPEAPRLSFEYVAWRRAWIRFGLVVALAAMLDYVILMRWLS